MIHLESEVACCWYIWYCKYCWVEHLKNLTCHTTKCEVQTVVQSIVARVLVGWIEVKHTIAGIQNWNSSTNLEPSNITNNPIQHGIPPEEVAKFPRTSASKHGQEWSKVALPFYMCLSILVNSVSQRQLIGCCCNSNIYLFTLKKRFETGLKLRFKFTHLETILLSLSMCSRPCTGFQ